MKKNDFLVYTCHGSSRIFTWFLILNDFFRSKKSGTRRRSQTSRELPISTESHQQTTLVAIELSDVLWRLHIFNSNSIPELWFHLLLFRIKSACVLVALAWNKKQYWRFISSRNRKKVDAMIVKGESKKRFDVALTAVIASFRSPIHPSNTPAPDVIYMLNFMSNFFPFGANERDLLEWDAPLRLRKNEERRGERNLKTN